MLDFIEFLSNINKLISCSVNHNSDSLYRPSQRGRRWVLFGAKRVDVRSVQSNMEETSLQSLLGEFISSVHASPHFLKDSFSNISGLSD